MNKPTLAVKYRRSNYYINKRFQTQFIIKFWLIMAAGSVLTAVLVYWLARHSTTVAMVNGKVVVLTTADYLRPLLLQTISIELVIVSLAVILMMLFISHQMAGPVYHFQQSLKALGQGDLSLIFFRRTDQFQEVAAAYNDAMQHWHDKIKAMKNASSLDDIKKILNTFKGL